MSAKELRIFFDFSCPYCYLAWGYFKKLRQEATLNDDWVSWEIHPEVPPEGSSLLEVVEVADLAERRNKLNALGAPVGITPGEKVFVPNTRWALAALEVAREDKKMHAWIDAVYHASFVEQKNIGSLPVLLDLARQVGLDAELLEQTLKSGRFESVLLDHDRECVERKIEWVPTVFLEEEKIIEGAFTFAEFEQVMRLKVLGMGEG